MRIGVNALYLIPGRVGGTEIYLRSLLRALAALDSENHYTVFTNAETGADLVPAAPNFSRAPQSCRAAIRPVRILWEQFLLPRAVKKAKLDVLLNPGFTSPAWRCCPNVTVFHDLQHVRHPEYFRTLDLLFWRLLLWSSARRSARLIAVSEATREDLRAHYGVDAAVIHHGVADDFFEIAPRREPRRFLLCVSTLHPHKNLDRLLRAFDIPDMQLVIAGLRGFHTSELERLIAERDLSSRVRLTGWIPRTELLELLRTAWAFIYPSTFEGFGMPVLEAMAAGLNVACSRIPALEEVGGNTVGYFDPLSEEQIRETMRRLASESSAPPASAQMRAREFSWERAARQTLDCLLEAARGADMDGR
jgi:glycosyltransferase involved in cell wall biosynthesis